MSTSSNTPNVAATCFHKVGGYLQTSGTGDSLNWQPCRIPKSDDDIVNCCVGGDLCMSNNICYFQHEPDSHDKTGYYRAGCSDSNYEDSTCYDPCSDSTPPDITYDNTNSTWTCCDTSAEDSSGDYSCTAPEGPSFTANETEPLTTLARAPITPTGKPLIIDPSYGREAAKPTSPNSRSSSTPSSSAEASSSSSSTSQPSNNDNGGGLSTGAKAGIGVGVAVGVLVILALIAFILLRRRKRARESGDSATLGGGGGDGSTGQGSEYYAEEKRGHESLPEYVSPEPHELGAGTPVHELPGRLEDVTTELESEGRDRGR